MRHVVKCFFPSAIELLLRPVAAPANDDVRWLCAHILFYFIPREGVPERCWCESCHARCNATTCAVAKIRSAFVCSRVVVFSWDRGLLRLQKSKRRKPHSLTILLNHLTKPSVTHTPTKTSNLFCVKNETHVLVSYLNTTWLVS